MGLFAAIALSMACMGIYGVMSYAVARRSREIGVPMALGALPGRVVALILMHGMKLLAAGTAVGVLGALGLTRYLGTMLYRTSPTHFTTFGGLALGLLIVGTLAGLLPALKAARVDPVIPLRNE